jgi:hypothetical protein
MSAVWHAAKPSERNPLKTHKGLFLYINHITLNTGHNARSQRQAVSDATLAIVAPWLLTAVNSGQQHPIPNFEDYAISAIVEDGGLVVTVYGRQPDIGPRMPLVTFGVAQRSRQGEPLWGLLTANFGAHASAKRPAKPWCAVALHVALLNDLKAAQWLGDFERCCAWAWITRNPDLRSA